MSQTITAAHSESIDQDIIQHYVASLQIASQCNGSVLDQYFALRDHCTKEVWHEVIGVFVDEKRAQAAGTS